MKTILHQKQETLTLAEETAFCAGLCVTYRLTSSTDPSDRTFYLSVLADKDACTASVGNDLMRATSIFRAVIQGFVTPCTLPDVLSDLQIAQNW
ncbi:MAG: hypothetical protein IJW55_05820 [Clostridia bacterium]|nr:hypothetical protein [Clostridia bacterium]